MFGGILPGSFLLWSILLENYLGSILLKSIQRKSSLRVVGIIPGFFLLESIHLEKNQLGSIQVKSIHLLWVFSIATRLVTGRCASSALTYSTPSGDDE